MFITKAIVLGYLIYKEKQLRKEEELATKLSKKTATDQSTTSSILSKRVIKQLITPFMEDNRNQQLQEMVVIEKSEDELAVDKNLKLSGTMLGIAVAGALVAPPLTYVALVGLAWSWRYVVKVAYEKLKQGKVGIEVLDLVACVSALVLQYAIVGSLASILYFGSKKLLLKTESYSKKRLVNIFGEQPTTVWILVNNIEIEIPFEQLEKGSIVVIHAGNMIPIDGKVVHGHALVDQRALTGESQPAEKQVGDVCHASTVVLKGSIQIKVLKAGSETVAAQIGDILNNSIDFKEEMIAKGIELGDKATPPILALGIFSMPFVGVAGSAAIFDSNMGLTMRLVSPMLMLNFLTIASNKGVLIKDGRSLELLSDIDTVVFDKTGTLTINQPKVANVHTFSNISEEELLIYAASAEYRQSHPIALAILETAKERKLALLPIEETKCEVGYGIKVYIDTTTIHVGSARFMNMEGFEIPATLENLAKKGQRNGYSFVYIAVNQQVAGAIELHPTIRPEAKQVIQILQANNKSCYIISGDHLWPTKHLARQVGIKNYFAEVLPEDKAGLVQMLQKENKKVCFIGDGINDSIALKRADVSISLKGASTLATDTAQIILMNENLDQLPFLFEMGNQYDKYMENNLACSVVPSLLTIGGALFFHFGLGAAVLMNQIALMAGVANSVQPLLNHPQKEETEKRINAVSPTNTTIKKQQQRQRQRNLKGKPELMIQKQHILSKEYVEN